MAVVGPQKPKPSYHEPPSISMYPVPPGKSKRPAAEQGETATAKKAKVASEQGGKFQFPKGLTVTEIAKPAGPSAGGRIPVLHIPDDDEEEEEQHPAKFLLPSMRAASTNSATTASSRMVVSQTANPTPPAAHHGKISTLG